jgi:hypothetical protein
MDDSKRVRELSQDPRSKNLQLSRTLDLCKQDQEEINKTPFDEFAISPSVLHWKHKYMTLIDNKARDNPTWLGESIMLKSYEHLAGPQPAQNCGYIFYVEQYSQASGA